MSEKNTDKVAILVKRAALEFEKVSNPYFIKYNLTTSQYKVLKYLYAMPTRTARIVDLEHSYSMTHPTSIGLVSALEEKGFVTRIDNPEDGRGKLVALTKKADLMQEELEALGLTIEEEFTKSLSNKEKEELCELLNKLLKE